MEIFYIVLLVFLGLLFLVAELVLLPGISVGAVLALICYGAAVFLAFHDFGVVSGVWVLVAILGGSFVAAVVSLRAKTWQRFSLQQEIRSSSMPVPPDRELHVGDRGTTLSRLSPMGKAQFGDRIYEAKTLGSYVDPQCEVEIIGFENFSVLVKTVK